MSLLWRLLWSRAGHQELPSDIGPDKFPGEPEEPDNPLPALHLTDQDFAEVAAALDVQVAAIRAVAEIEAAGRGFLADGRPQILYEAHVFGRLTSHRHELARDNRGVALSSRRWNRSLYGAAGAHQHDVRLASAAALDWGQAHRACSWGLFQIMGFNHQAVGFLRIDEFVQAMTRGARAHLDAFAAFIRANKLDEALRERRWAAFARRYNGPGFAANSYDTKLANAYAKWSRA